MVEPARSVGGYHDTVCHPGLPLLYLSPIVDHPGQASQSADGYRIIDHHLAELSDGIPGLPPVGPLSANVDFPHSNQRNFAGGPTLFQAGPHDVFQLYAGLHGVRIR